MQARRQVLLGTLLILVSSLAYSTAGFFTRLIALDIWTILFWRGLFAGLLIGAFIIWQHGRGAGAMVRAIGRNGIWVALCSTLATLCFLNAMRLTTVAEVMVINATLPFVTAALAWAFTAERERWTTLAASFVALVGVVIMFDPGAGRGVLLGDLLAVIMTVALAVMMVVIRASRDVSMLPAVGLSALLCPLVVAPLASPGAPDALSFVYLMLFGMAQFGLGLLLLALGTRLISATRSALIGSLELPLAPVWVWLAFGETPSRATLAGGLVVAVAVVADILTVKPQA